MNCHICGSEDVRLFQTGYCCTLHTPAAVAGRPEAVIDPERTATALYAKNGIKHGYQPNASSLIDERAIASGRRRFKNQAEYRNAQRQEDERKQAEKQRRKA